MTSDQEKELDLSKHPLVETAWLAERLHDARLRVVDARWRGDGSSKQLFRQGHIPGAVHLDWHYDLSYTKEHVDDLLLPPAQFANVVGAAGIGDETKVVLYGETDHSGAARLWWALRYFGHEQVALLNGGLTKWLAEGRPLSTEVAQPPLAHFTPRPRPELLATAAEIERAFADSRANVCLVDTRPREQYEGAAVWTPAGSLYLPPGQDWVEVHERRMRSGHIPGARHLHASRNLNPGDWTYLNPEAIREQALAAGIQPEQRVITYCGVGISASLGLFALHLAGFQDLALYDGSWAEWGTDPNRPVARKECTLSSSMKEPTQSR